MSKEGLVAPVWSDAGQDWSAQFENGVYTIGTAEWIARRVTEMEGKGVRCLWTKPVQTYTYSFEGIKWPTFDFTPPKVSTARDAIPALTRVSGNKRGPGWCDE